MSKISPACGSTARPRRPRNSTSRCCRFRIETVQRNTVDGPAGKAGTVLVVEFTLAGQRFMALNGGMRMEYTHAVSFKIDCADQAEVDRLWDALLGERRHRPNAAAGSRIATACPGRSCRRRCSKYLGGAGSRPARSARCRPCWGWSSSISRACAAPMKASRRRDRTAALPRRLRLEAVPPSRRLRWSRRRTFAPCSR